MVHELAESVLGPGFHSHMWTAESHYPSSTEVSFKCPCISESKTEELKEKEF